MAARAPTAARTQARSTRGTTTPSLTRDHRLCVRYRGQLQSPARGVPHRRKVVRPRLLAGRHDGFLACPSPRALRDALGGGGRSEVPRVAAAVRPEQASSGPVSRHERHAPDHAVQLLHQERRDADRSLIGARRDHGSSQVGSGARVEPVAAPRPFTLSAVEGSSRRFDERAGTLASRRLEGRRRLRGQRGRSRARAQGSRRGRCRRGCGRRCGRWRDRRDGGRARRLRRRGARRCPVYRRPRRRHQSARAERRHPGSRASPPAARLDRDRLRERVDLRGAGREAFSRCQRARACKPGVECRAQLAAERARLLARAASDVPEQHDQVVAREVVTAAEHPEGDQTQRESNPRRRRSAWRRWLAPAPCSAGSPGSGRSPSRGRRLPTPSWRPRSRGSSRSAAGLRARRGTGSRA